MFCFTQSHYRFIRAYRENQENQVRLVSMVYRVKVEKSDLPEHPVSLEPKEKWEHQDDPDSMVLKATAVFPVNRIYSFVILSRV